MAGNINSGTRKAKLWRDCLATQLLRPLDDEMPKPRNALESIVATQIQLAVGGDINAIKDIADRLDGKPAQAITGGDEGDSSITFTVIYEAKKSLSFTPYLAPAVME